MFAYMSSAIGNAEVRRPRAAQQARGDRGVGHQRRGFRHIVPDAPQIHDVLVIGFAEVIPDRGVRRHHVGLIAAIGDHAVHRVPMPQMFAAEIPADVHEFHGIERASPAPWRRRRVRALAFETVFHRDQARRVTGGSRTSPSD